MMALRQPAALDIYAVELDRPDDFDAWRAHARTLVQCGVPPENVTWNVDGKNADLFAVGNRTLPQPGPTAPNVRASKRFIGLARNAALHSDPQRFALLYLLLWKLQSNPQVMEDKADPIVRRVEELDKNVRRDSHKMHAFVRFRCVEGENGEQRYVAWFEPEHHIVRANAGFFMRRFANMNWSILTPRGSLHWDTHMMREGPPASREDAPISDPTEELWRKYYASIFNPARLKVDAMLSEMPKKYWKNLPEASLIPDLIASAQSREAKMVEAGKMAFDERPDTLETLDKLLHGCRKCPIGALDNRTVMGEGPRDAELMIVGEQPGDQEDRSGRPFVGPAGQLLDLHLQKAGIDRSAAYVTNAVKHFKYIQRGKRRIHQNPGAKEIDTCRWWLESERAIIKPKVILAMGSSAARAMLGKTVSISKARGAPIALEDGSELWITAHPSYLLRLDGDACARQTALFDADLAAVKERFDELVAS